MDIIPGTLPPLVLSTLLRSREPDFKLGQFSVYIHQLIPADAIVVCSGDIVFISQNGNWRKLTKEEFESKLMEVLHR